jgi:amino acid adenylation domain-containing protein
MPPGRNNTGAYIDLVGLLQYQAAEPSGETRGYVFLSEGKADFRLTYKDLDRQARAVGGYLQSMGMQGERALLLYPPGLSFLVGFFGCLYAGAVPVPAYSPRHKRAMSRIVAIGEDAQARAVLTNSAESFGPVEKIDAFVRGARPLLVATDALPVPTGGASRFGWEDAWRPITFAANDVAYLQYTSGSTSSPRGVMITHANVLANARGMVGRWGHSDSDVFMTWLPHFHDMGLVFGLLLPLYQGVTCFQMSPSSFVQRPLRWIEALSRYNASHTAAPNFAYDLCTRAEAADLGALDLSSLRVALNGAEPVQRDTMDRFAAAFRGAGLSPDACRPGYGLAEATLVVSAVGAEEAPRFCELEPVPLSRGHAIEAVKARGDGKAVTGVSCGLPLECQRVAVVEPVTARHCTPGEVGEVWVSGPCVASGYWNRPGETDAVFGARLAGEGNGDGRYLRTGDLAFLSDGHVYITGRIKDVIIVRGRNFYPQDIERAVQDSHRAFRQHGGAAFGVEIDGEERLVVVQELERGYRNESLSTLDELASVARQAVMDECELNLYTVVFLKRGTLPMTSSGKVQRSVCRTMFLQGTLDCVEGTPPRGADQAGECPPPVVPDRLAFAALDRGKRLAVLEAYLVRLLAARLGDRRLRVRSQDTLMNLGVDSISIVSLANRVHSEWGVSVPLARLLDDPSISELAEEIVEAMPASSSSHGTPSRLDGESNSDEGTEPLLGQCALWFQHSLRPDSAIYNIARAASIQGTCDTGALSRALQTLARRHDALRSVFAQGVSGLRLHVSPDASPSFEEEDLTSLSQEQARARIQEEAMRPFDLAVGPLMRVRLFTHPSQGQILLIVIHHIIADFWSVEIILRELAHLYVSDASGGGGSLAPLPDRSERLALVADADQEAHWSYWQAQLSDPSPALPLPTRPGPAPPRAIDSTCRSHPFRLDRELSDALRALSSRSRTTLFTTVLSAFFVLLHRYTGESDILVGVPTAGRSRPSLESAVGYFVNPIMLRADLSDDPEFGEFLSRVRQRVIDGLTHKDFPFVTLVERLRPERRPDGPPLIQVMFVWQAAHTPGRGDLAAFALELEGAALDWGDLRLNSYPLQEHASEYELTVSFCEHQGEIRGTVGYNVARFDARTAERLAGHLEVLLRAAASDTTTRVRELPLLTAKEQEEQIAYGSGASAVAGPEGRAKDSFVQHSSKTLDALFRARAQGTPDAPALVSSAGRVWSFRELDEASDRLGGYLRRRGVGPETLVGICLGHSSEWVYAALGILKAGGAYLPLDPSSPSERLAGIIRDAGVDHVVMRMPPERESGGVPDAAREFVSGAATHIVCLDRDCEAISNEGNIPLPSFVTPENLAYVIYTSGSTGRPKGVAIRHASVADLLAALWEEVYAEHSGSLRVAVGAPFTFDASVKQVFALLHGHCLCVLPEHTRADPAATLDYVVANRVNVLDVTPSLLELLLDAGLAERELPTPFLLLVGGEPIGPALWDRAAALKNAHVYNLYGPTECTVDATVCLVSGQAGTAPHIGHPLPGVHCYVLDPFRRPVPAGIAGELYIGGTGVARGYHRDPGLTAERFLPDPFRAAPFDGVPRLYRTGDLARFDHDGRLYYLMRRDRQLKVRGYRVEPAEIEVALRSHPQVSDAAVLLREGHASDGSPTPSLIAFLALRAGQDVPPKELRRFLKMRLPEYLIPSAFDFVARLPLTRAGKVDYAALGAIPVGGAAISCSENPFVSPRTDAEQRLADLWSQLLGVAPIGVEDSFFALGGHSLLLAQLATRIRGAFGVRVPLARLFEALTISSMTLVIAEAQVEQAGADEVNRLLDEILRTE